MHLCMDLFMHACNCTEISNSVVFIRFLLLFSDAGVCPRNLHYEMSTCMYICMHPFMHACMHAIILICLVQLLFSGSCSNFQMQEYVHEIWIIKCRHACTPACTCSCMHACNCFESSISVITSRSFLRILIAGACA